MNVIETENITKVYNPEKIPVVAVDHITMEVKEGEFTAIVGPSGCGKTTLLNMIGGLDHPTEGSVRVAGTDISTLSESRLTDFRLRNIGFVFQSYNLVPVLTARENIEFIMLLQKRKSKERKDRVEFLLDRMDMLEQIDRKPAELSGGQQQRVAVARAMASRPAVILADEPTANLDSKSTGSLLDMMARLNEEEKVTFIFSTHDQRVIDKAHRIISLEDGRIIDDKTVKQEVSI